MTNCDISNILVSIILPTYNSEKYIRATLQSVLNQTHECFELIVLDDCSTDSTIEIIEQFAGIDSRLSITKLLVNSGGPATPRNKGLKLANGKFIAFIDSDDIWHPDKLNIQLTMMRIYKLNFSSTKLALFENDHQIEMNDLQAKLPPKFVSHNELLKKNVYATSSVMLTAKLAIHLRFPQSQEYVAIEDYFAWLMLHQLPVLSSGVLPQRLLFYRYRNNSISNSKSMMAAKVYYLLSNYIYRGKGLGVKKYYYFVTYIVGAVRSTMSR